MFVRAFVRRGRHSTIPVLRHCRLVSTAAVAPVTTTSSSVAPAIVKPRKSKAKTKVSGTTTPADASALPVAADLLAATAFLGRTSTIIASATIASAADVLLQSTIGCAVVLDHNDHVVGIITERDLLTAANQRRQNLTVDAVMTPAHSIICANPSDDVYTCLHLMANQSFRHLPVLDANRLLGVLSMTALVNALFAHTPGLSPKAEFMRDVQPRLGLPRNTSLQTSEQARIRVRAAVADIPHPDKRKKGGEDSSVCMRHGSGHVLAVFDGVGSWSIDKNVDVAKFSRQLAKAVHETVETTDTPLLPMPLLEAAAKSVRASHTVGSATACILTIYDGHLRAVTLGDSGFLLLRKLSAMQPKLPINVEQPSSNSKLLITPISSPAMSSDTDTDSDYTILYRSPIQLHYFNCPAQLGVTERGNDAEFDQPSDAVTLSVEVAADDILIIATDGLYDNLTEETILRCVNECEEPVDSSVLANALVQRAHTASMDKSVDSPFALLAKENNIAWGGGRKDDITVIAAVVTRGDDSSG